MRTQVGIVGGRPAGLVLSHLLHVQGIESVVLELRSRHVVETTVRAGVLEHGTAELLREKGVGERMDRRGAVHNGVNLQFGGRRHRIDFPELTGVTSSRAASTSLAENCVGLPMEPLPEAPDLGRDRATRGT
jgi:p-hydroxybenzoate 3-monooxygenase